MSILTEPRFSFDVRPTQPESLWHVRAAWISDVHLGTRTSNAPALLQFLRDYECERLYNHDEFVGTFAGSHGNISIQQHAIHVMANGRRMLVIHGHELDSYPPFPVSQPAKISISETALVCRVCLPAPTDRKQSRHHCS